jgi:DNA mismatch repair protein MutS
VPVWASKSYWLDVAKLAGIPKIIIERAKSHLLHLEDNKKTNWTKNDLPLWFGFPPIKQTDPKFEKIKTLLESYDINAMTPLQALQFLAKLKDELSEEL